MNRRFRAALLFSVLALPAACGRTPAPAPSPAPSVELPATSDAAAPVTATATPADASADLAGANAASAALVEQAVTFLFLDPQAASIIPLDSAALLTAAYTRAAQAPRTPGAPPVPPIPAFTGDPRADLELFRPAYFTLLAGVDETTDRAEFARNAIRALVDRANMPFVVSTDPYVAAVSGPCNAVDFFDAVATADSAVRNTTSERYVGTGFQIFPAGQNWVLRGIDPETPAERAGLKRGDVVLAVDGVAISGLPYDTVRTRLRGAAGSPVTLTIRRVGEDTPRDVVVTRALLTVPRVISRVIVAAGGRRVGLLQLSPLVDPGIPPEVRQALAAFETQGVDAWILDLRDVSRSYTESLIQVAGAFVPEGTTVVSTLDRLGARRRFPARPNDRVTPQHSLAVLVDSTTRSVGEILAATLQDHGIGRVFGGPTDGCVVSGVPHPLPDGSSLWTRTFTLLSGAGRNLHGTGMQPDEVVAPDRSWVTDPPLDAALAWLMTQP